MGVVYEAPVTAPGHPNQSFLQIPKPNTTCPQPPHPISLPRTHMPHDTPTRISAAPFIALFLAIFSLAGCIINAIVVHFLYFNAVLVFFALPVISLAALLISLRILLTVARNDSINKPFTRAPALIAFLLALLALVAQLAISGVGLSIYLPMKRLVLPAADEMVRAVNADRPDRALAAFSTTYQSRITPQELDTLFATLTDRLGPIQEIAFDLSTVERARDALSSLTGTADLAMENPPKPVEVRCRDGIAMLWILLDESALARGEVRFQDLLIVLPDQTALTLFPDGRMALYTRSLGLTPLDWRATLPPSGPQPREEGDPHRSQQQGGNESPQPGG